MKRKRTRRFITEQFEKQNKKIKAEKVVDKCDTSSLLKKKL